MEKKKKGKRKHKRKKDKKNLKKFGEFTIGISGNDGGLVEVSLLKLTQELVVESKHSARTLSFPVEFLENITKEENDNAIHLFFLRASYSSARRAPSTSNITKIELSSESLKQTSRIYRTLLSRLRNNTQRTESTHVVKGSKTLGKSRKRIRPGNFYGASENPKLSKPEFENDGQQRERKYFIIFPRQADAFNHVDSLGVEDSQYRGEGWDRPKVFCVEHSKSGTRQFVVSGRKSLLKHLLSLSPLQRHVYEIIRENAISRLYFDLEYSKSVNPTLNGDGMVVSLIRYVGLELESLFGIRIRKQDIVDLESTSSTKFSRHLIFICRKNHLFPKKRKTNFPVDKKENDNLGHLINAVNVSNIDGDNAKDGVSDMILGETVFRNNRDCGHFVKYFVSKYKDKFLVWDKDKKSRVSFVDTGVYTRNRAFRMYLSCKFGKSAILEPSPSSSFPFDDSSKEGILKLLESSMVSPFSGNSERHEVFDMNKIPVTEMNPVAINSKKIGRDVPCSKVNGQQQQQAVVYKAEDSCTYSSYPFIDRYILQFASRSCPTRPAKIRSWSLVENDGECLVYNLCGNRYCYRIRREHKSNNVYYMVFISKRTFIQKCYDPDCRGFSSKEFPLPESTLPSK